MTDHLSSNPIRHFIVAVTGFTLMAGCAATPDPVITADMRRIEGGMPVDFGGSWAMDYARSDNINDVLRETYYRLARSTPGSRMTGLPGSDVATPIDRKMDRIVPLARLAELITRSDELTITQTDSEIVVERIDDFAVFCAFYNGVAKATDSPFGRELCGWDGDRLVSELTLLDGLQVIHRFAVSEDGKQLRIVTTVASDTSSESFSLRRFYWKFEKPAPAYECIETLSMKRVCSTGSLTP